MKSRKIIYLLILIILLVIIFYPQNKHYVILEGKKIFIEVADSSEEREKGLMYRDELCDDCGMLFIFEQEGFYNFWMKNTSIPLDIIFINSNLEVVDFLYAAPCRKDFCESYAPKEKSLYVLEVNYGVFSEEVVGKMIRISPTLKL